MTPNLGGLALNKNEPYHNVSDRDKNYFKKLSDLMVDSLQAQWFLPQFSIAGSRFDARKPFEIFPVYTGV